MIILISVTNYLSSKVPALHAIPRASSLSFLALSSLVISNYLRVQAPYLAKKIEILPNVNSRNRTLIKTPVVNVQLSNTAAEVGFFMVDKGTSPPSDSPRCITTLARQPTGNAPVLTSLEGCCVLVQLVSCLVKYSM